MGSGGRSTGIFARATPVNSRCHICSHSTTMATSAVGTASGPGRHPTKPWINSPANQSQPSSRLSQTLSTCSLTTSIRSS